MSNPFRLGVIAGLAGLILVSPTPAAAEDPFDADTLAHDAISFGLGQIPEVGGIAGLLFDKLWNAAHEEQPVDPWDAIRERAIVLIEAQIDQRLDDYEFGERKSDLEGVRRALNLYQSHPTMENWNPLRLDIIEKVPNFQKDEYAVLDLPLFVQVATLHLALMRDGAMFSESEWGKDKKYADMFYSDPDSGEGLADLIDEYSRYAYFTYQKGRNEATRGGEQACGCGLMSYDRAMVQSVLPLVETWRFLDPRRYPKPPAPIQNTWEIFSPVDGWVPNRQSSFPYPNMDDADLLEDCDFSLKGPITSIVAQTQPVGNGSDKALNNLQVTYSGTNTKEGYPNMWPVLRQMGADSAHGPDPAQAKITVAPSNPVVKVKTSRITDDMTAWSVLGSVGFEFADGTIQWRGRHTGTNDPPHYQALKEPNEMPPAGTGRFKPAGYSYSFDGYTLSSIVLSGTAILPSSSEKNLVNAGYKYASSTGVFGFKPRDAQELGYYEILAGKKAYFFLGPNLDVPGPTPLGGDGGVHLMGYPDTTDPIDSLSSGFYYHILDGKDRYLSVTVENAGNADETATLSWKPPDREYNDMFQIRYIGNRTVRISWGPGDGFAGPAKDAGDCGSKGPFYYGLVQNPEGGLPLLKVGPGDAFFLRDNPGLKFIDNGRLFAFKNVKLLSNNDPIDDDVANGVGPNTTVTLSMDCDVTARIDAPVGPHGFQIYAGIQDHFAQFLQSGNVPAGETKSFHLETSFAAPSEPHIHFVGVYIGWDKSPKPATEIMGRISNGETKQLGIVLVLPSSTTPGPIKYDTVTLVKSGELAGATVVLKADLTANDSDKTLAGTLSLTQYNPPATVSLPVTAGSYESKGKGIAASATSGDGTNQIAIGLDLPDGWGKRGNNQFAYHVNGKNVADTGPALPRKTP